MYHMQSILAVDIERRVFLFPRGVFVLIMLLLCFWLLLFSLQRRPSHRAPVKGKGVKGSRGRVKGSGSITQSLRLVGVRASSFAKKYTSTAVLHCGYCLIPGMQ